MSLRKCLGLGAKVKILIIILLTLSIQGNEVFGMDKKEFQATIINSMIDGATGVITEAKELIVNPPDLAAERKKTEIKHTCNKKYWELQRKTEKKWWIYQYENIDMEKALRKKHINYNIILKQQVRKKLINVDKLREKSCSKQYFDLAYKQKNRLNTVKQKNKILKELVEVNQIEIEKKEELYYKKENKEKAREKAKAKKELKKQMMISDTTISIEQAIKDVD